MNRADLKQIIAKAAKAAKCNREETGRLVATADRIDRIAVGVFKFKGDDGKMCGCPATLAGYWTGDKSYESKRNGGWSDESSENIKRFPSQFDSRIGRNHTKRDKRHDYEYIPVTD